MTPTGLDLSNLILPPLPNINSKSVRDQAFTHRGYHARPNHLFEDPPEDPSPDNEKLEHLGDTVIALVVTTLMNDMYPGLRVGPATKARAMIVGNATLAEISAAYKLPEKLRLHPSQKLTLMYSSSIRADVFESFVGGLYVDQGLDVVQLWLKELLRPLIDQAYTAVKAQHGFSASPQPTSPIDGPATPPTPSDLPGRLPRGYSVDPPGTMTTSGHLALFNQSLQKAGRTVEWIYSPISVDGNGIGSDTSSVSSGLNTGSVSPTTTSSDSSIGQQSPVLDRAVLKSLKTTPIWYATVTVDGEIYGNGKGVTKKAARNEAAKTGLEKLGIIV
ncbi:hypothetical protein VKT23_001680 [Stygiomarasmius scandens]